jgi:hypothetical protein
VLTPAAAEVKGHDLGRGDDDLPIAGGAMVKINL